MNNNKDEQILFPDLSNSDMLTSN